MLDKFKAKGYVEGGIIKNRRNEELDIAALPPILRTLLVTDGTVTKTLEAYYWEPLQVNPLGQSLICLDYDIAEMNCNTGDSVLQRNVSIEGQNSGDIYAFATSILNLKTLPQFVQEQLISGKIGIGELLRDQGLETYRQVVDIFREIQHDIVPNLASVYCGEMICRTYFIYYNKIPVIQVTEKFPFRLYQRK